MAQNGKEPPENRTIHDHKSGSEESISSLTELQAGPINSLTDRQVDVAAEVSNLENENASLSEEFREIQVKVSDLKVKIDGNSTELDAVVKNLEGQVSDLNDRLGHVNSFLRQENRIQMFRFHQTRHILQQLSVDQTAAATEKDQARAAQERTNRALVGAVNRQSDLHEQSVNELEGKIKQLESEVKRAQLTADNAMKAKDQQEITNRALLAEIRRLARSVDYLIGRDGENQQAHASQQNTILALVGGTNLRFDRIMEVTQDVTDIEKKVEQLERKVNAVKEQLEEEVYAVGIAANSALKGVNEINIPEGLQQADGNDGDNELVSE